MKAIYTAPTVPAAEEAFETFAHEWRDTYPAMIASWESAWDEFVPFLESPAELRTIVYTTNSIESLNARFRRAVRNRGHFPNEQAALKVLYLVANQNRPNRADLVGSKSDNRAVSSVPVLTFASHCGQVSSKCQNHKEH